MKKDEPTGNEAKKPYALGLVLSGGGVRGVAHVGVLRALMEHDVFPDCIAGVSAGAIVGALYAAGHSEREMIGFFQTINPVNLAHFAFAKPGFLDTQKLIPLFDQYFPDNSFEELKRKLLVVATDILSGQPVTFASGELIRPVLASSSVPIVYSPTEINGRWFCDGGIADNFPAHLLTGCCDRILGVHVGPLRSVEIAELGTSMSVLERALDIGMFLQARAKFSLCDLVIQPPGLDGFGMFDKKRVKDIEATGYAAAMARMPEILAMVGEGRKKAEKLRAEG